MTGFSFVFGAADKPTIGSPIPRSTKVLVRLTYAPGGADLPGTPPGQKTGALTASKSSDSLYLKAELTVQRGPYKGRKFWSNLTVSGGKLDEKGHSIAAGITRQNIFAMLSSANGLSLKDDSPEANAKRVLPNGFPSLQGLMFVAKVGVEIDRNGQYPDKNSLGTILTIDHKDWPKSEAELDNPVVEGGPAAAPALPAPAWGEAVPAAAPVVQAAPAFQAPPAVVSAPVPAATASPTLAAPVQGVVQAAPGAAPQPANNAGVIPGWMAA